MAETSAEVVYVGKGKPSFLEKHTPRAHTEAMMRKYFWVTDHLEGKPREIAEKIRPLVEKSAKLTGWMQTTSELVLAATAVAVVGIVAKNKFKPTFPVIPTTIPTQPEILPDLGKQAKHIRSEDRWAGFQRVTQAIGNPPEPKPRAPKKVKPPPKQPVSRFVEPSISRDDMAAIGKEAKTAAERYRELAPTLPRESGRHFGRAVMETYILLTDPEGQAKVEELMRHAPKGADRRTVVFLWALEKTMPKDPTGVDVNFAVSAFEKLFKDPKLPNGV